MRPIVGVGASLEMLQTHRPRAGSVRVTRTLPSCTIAESTHELPNNPLRMSPAAARCTETPSTAL